MSRSDNRRLGSELSSSLTTTISTLKSKIDKWAEMECAQADALVQTHQKKLQYEQKAIDYHVADLLAVQVELGFKVHLEDNENVHSNATSESIAQRKQAMEDSYLAMEAEIAHLEIDFNKRNMLVNEIQLDHGKQEARAKEARELKKRVKESKQTTVDDLTRGIVNYKYLGLDFEKADGENELRFIFSCLDPDDPNRQFSFVLQVDNDDKYEVASCQPSVDAAVVRDVTERLNQADDMSYLVHRMREAFTETL